jgi:transcriptional regulator with XRE-family HTH domain
VPDNLGCMQGNLAFTPGGLEREIVIRGLSQEAFADFAGIDPATVSRAIRGQRLKSKSFGKILTALGRIPVIEGPVELVRSA